MWCVSDRVNLSGPGSLFACACLLVDEVTAGLRM